MATNRRKVLCCVAVLVAAGACGSRTSTAPKSAVDQSLASTIRGRSGWQERHVEGSGDLSVVMRPDAVAEVRSFVPERQFTSGGGHITNVVYSLSLGEIEFRSASGLAATQG